MKVNFKVKMKVTIEFPVEKFFRNCTDLWLGYVSECRIFRFIDCRCKKKGVSIQKNKVDLEKAMKVNFKVKMKVTIEFLVEIYFRNDLDFFEKYFTWWNIQPSRDFLDTLYNFYYCHFSSLLIEQCIIILSSIKWLKMKLGVVASPNQKLKY